VGALFIVSAGLLRTGTVGIAANRLMHWSRGGKRFLFFLLLFSVAAASAFLNNTPVVAMFIPVALTLCSRLGLSPSRLLIPVSFAAILGGMCTLIGTSTNIMVASIAAENEGLTPPGMFEFTKLGIVFAALGLPYLLFAAKYLLPDRSTIASITAAADRRLKEYVTELGIRAGGALAGLRFDRTPLARDGKIRVIQVIRGEEILWPPFDDLVLEEGDTLVVAGPIEQLVELQSDQGFHTLDEILDVDRSKPESREIRLAEILVLPNSSYVGMPLEEARFRRRFQVTVVAIQRHGLHLRRKIPKLPLKVGDILLVQGSESDLGRLGNEEGLILLSDIEDVLVRKKKAPVACAILFLVVLSLTFRLLPMVTTALAAALAMVLTGCLPPNKIYDAVPWRILVLIAGMLALGAAMQETHTADWIAWELTSLFRFGGPWLLLVVTLVLTTLLTECVTNTAVAAIMLPIALRISTRCEVDPYPFMMAVAFGASSSFLTPIGYQTNTLVYGVGGYKFGDFFRAGLGLVLIVWIAGGALIPLIWPF